jgi:hypothetical protein
MSWNAGKNGATVVGGKWSLLMSALTELDYTAPEPIILQIAQAQSISMFSPIKGTVSAVGIRPGSTI